jgi:hypothetical protein
VAAAVAVAASRGARRLPRGAAGTAAVPTLRLLFVCLALVNLALEVGPLRVVVQAPVQRLEHSRRLPEVAAGLALLLELWPLLLLLVQPMEPARALAQS